METAQIVMSITPYGPVKKKGEPPGLVAFPFHMNHVLGMLTTPHVETSWIRKTVVKPGGRKNGVFRRIHPKTSCSTRESFKSSWDSLAQTQTYKIHLAVGENSGKWNQPLKPAVPLWLNLDSSPSGWTKWTNSGKPTG